MSSSQLPSGALLGSATTGTCGEEERGVVLAYSRIRADLLVPLDHFSLATGVPQYSTNREAVAQLGGPEPGEQRHTNE